MVLSLQAMIGFWKAKPVVLRIFTGVLILLCILLVALGISAWAMQETFWSIIENYLNIQLQAYNTERQSIKWLVDTVQTRFSCCGTVSKSDWGEKNSGFICNENLCKLPSSCCKPGVQNCGYLSNSNSTGFETDSTNAVFEDGCVSKISEKAVSRPIPLVIGWICVWLFMMFELFTINLILKGEQLVNQIHSKITEAKEKEIPVYPEFPHLNSGMPSTKNSTLRASSNKSDSLPEVAPRAPFRKSGNTETMMNVDVHEI